MNQSDLLLKRVTLEETALVSNILIDVTQALIARGEPLWTPEQFVPDKLQPIVQAGEAWIAFVGDGAAGVVFLQSDDPEFWPDVPVGQSLFIHKLAVHPGFAGRNLSSVILDWAKLQAERQGRRFLRLDCDDRPKLRAVYESFGFILRDIRRVGSSTVCRYELPLEPESVS